MEIPSLPTDNLYKFLALSGVITFIVFNYLLISTSFKNWDERSSLRLEMKLVAHDTTLLSTSRENYVHTRYIITQYVSQRFKDQIPFINKKDSILSLDMIYFLALKNSELMPAYEKTESLYYEVKKQYYEFDQKIIKIEGLSDALQTKDIQFTLLVILTVFFDIIGCVLGFKGFKLWYTHVQIYQDEALKKSAIINK